MRKSNVVVPTILFLLSILPLKLCGETTSSNFDIVYDYPLMNRFYRNMPVLAENFYDSPDAAHLDPPAFLLDPTISFPYQKRTSYAHEVLFADNVNIVRFLGGWSAQKNSTTIEDISQWDLAYRDANGNIQYRWNLIPARIDPILEMGYNSPNIVLDNTPWCFPLVPYEPDGEGYGQCNPPRDLNEWALFIHDFCTELVRLYGYDRVNTWGFRLGTEAGGPTRFNGTDDEYRAFYKATALAVSGVLPGAKFFPYNRAAKGHDNLRKLLREARTEGFRYDASPISTYSISGLDTNNEPLINPVNPNTVAVGPATSMWYDFDTITAPNTISREVHEYGWFLVNELGDRDSAPGARGAAGNFHYIMNLRHYRLDKFFHWSGVDPTTDAAKNILNSQGFILSIWDYCNDADRVVELNNTLRDTPQSTQLYKSVGFFNSAGRSYIMISGYNMNRYQKNKNELSVYIPKSVFNISNLKITYTTLNDSTDHYRMLRNDLSQKGVLYTQYANDSDFVPQYNTMSAKGKYWLQTNNDKYAQRIKENLTLKPYKGQVQTTDEGIVLTIPITTPELFVIALEENTLAGVDPAELGSSKVSIYPTLVQDEFAVYANNANEIEIYDLTGKKALQQTLTTSNTVQVPDLKPGIYLAKVKHQNTTTNLKFIKL